MIEIINKAKELLREMSEGRPKKKYDGICGNLLDEDIHIFKEVLNYYFSTWEHFSGDFTYPVPDPKNIKTPHTIYMFHSSNKWVGEYGKLRQDLARHILEQMELDNAKF